VGYCDLSSQTQGVIVIYHHYQEFFRYIVTVRIIEGGKPEVEQLQ
jgi:hypothetical protein